MSNQSNPVGGVLRRTGLKPEVGAVDALSIVTSTTASSGGGTSDTKEEDSAERFSVEIHSGHANVPGAVAAPFETGYDEGDTDAIVSALPDDALSAVVATVTWKPEGTSV